MIQFIVFGSLEDLRHPQPKHVVTKKEQLFNLFSVLLVYFYLWTLHNCIKHTNTIWIRYGEWNRGMTCCQPSAKAWSFVLLAVTFPPYLVSATVVVSSTNPVIYNKKRVRGNIFSCSYCRYLRESCLLIRQYWFCRPFWKSPTHLRFVRWSWGTWDFQGGTWTLFRCRMKECCIWGGRCSTSDTLKMWG